MARKWKVLLVEDEPLITLWYEHLLDGTAFDLKTSTCTRDALSSLRADRPDLAIVDLFLDNGPCETVMRHFEQTGIPFIVVRSLGDPEFSRVPRERQITKPFRGRTLRSALRRLTAELMI